MINKYIFLTCCSISLNCFATLENAQAVSSGQQGIIQQPVIVIPAQTAVLQPIQQKPDSFNQSIAASLIPGMAIGAANGLAWHVIDKTILGPKLCWLLWPVEFGTRKVIESRVMQIMREHHIKHSTSLLCTTAWMTDWVAYLLAWKFIKL